MASHALCIQRRRHSCCKNVEVIGVPEDHDRAVLHEGHGKAEVPGIVVRKPGERFSGTKTSDNLQVVGNFNRPLQLIWWTSVWTTTSLCALIYLIFCIHYVCASLVDSIKKRLTDVDRELIMSRARQMYHDS